MFVIIICVGDHALGCTPVRPLDIVFAVDSAAIGGINAQHVLEFVANVSEAVMGAQLVSMATVTSGCAGGVLDDRQFIDPESVKIAAAEYSIPSLDSLLRNMRLKAADGRSNAGHIGIVFVNKKLSPAEKSQSVREVMRARYQKTVVNIIAVGPDVNMVDIERLVVNGGQLWRVPSFQELPSLGRNVLFTLCTFGLLE